MAQLMIRKPERNAAKMTQKKWLIIVTLLLAVAAMGGAFHEPITDRLRPHQGVDPDLWEKLLETSSSVAFARHMLDRCHMDNRPLQSSFQRTWERLPLTPDERNSLREMAAYGNHASGESLNVPLAERSCNQFQKFADNMMLTFDRL